MNKIDKQLKLIIDTTLANKRLHADVYVSQIKKVILKEIMKHQVVDNRYTGWKEGYVPNNFVRVTRIKDLLE